MDVPTPTAAARPEPYAIAIPTRYLSLTHQKMTLTRLPSGSSASADHIDALLDHWEQTFNWRKEEQRLNSCVAPQFRVCLDAAGGRGRVRLRYYHAAAAKRRAVLLLVGETWAYTRLIPELVQSGVDVVCPDVPGTGWSDYIDDEDDGDGDGDGDGNLGDVAKVFTALMTTLSYAHYFIHASGVLGWTIARRIALHAAPDTVVGVHVCGVPRPPVWWKRILRRISPPRQQQQRNEALVYALTDSPVGLLRWVLSHLSFPPPAITSSSSSSSFTHDDILAAFMYYWTPGPRGLLHLLAESDGAHMRCGVPVRWEKVVGGPWSAWTHPEEVAQSIVGFVDGKFG